MQPLLKWKSNNCCIFWVCVCSLSYAVCNPNAPYCHLSSIRLYSIFPRYLINWTIFGKTLLNINVCFDVCIVRFEWNLNILDKFSKNTQVSNFMKIHPMGAQLFHADGQVDKETDIMKLTVAFRQYFSKAPNNCSLWKCSGKFHILEGKKIEISTCLFLFLCWYADT